MICNTACQRDLIPQFVDTSTPAHTVAAGAGLITTGLMDNKMKNPLLWFLLVSGCTYLVMRAVLNENSV